MLEITKEQQKEINKIFDRVETIKQHIEAIDNRLNRLETKFDEQTALLTEILKRLPK